MLTRVQSDTDVYVTTILYLHYNYIVITSGHNSMLIDHNVRFSCSAIVHHTLEWGDSSLYNTLAIVKLINYEIHGLQNMHTMFVRLKIGIT